MNAELLESTEFYYAALPQNEALLRSWRSVMNFAQLLVFEQTERNSANLFCMAVRTINSEGDIPVRIVRSHDPNDAFTSSV